MANESPSRPGQINSAGDPLAIFLKVFSGEVLAAFNRESAYRPRHMVRTIANGKSAQFPATGLALAQYHSPGAEILGQSINQNERIISIEDLLIAPIFVANIDEAMAHYDYRAPYSDQIGQALAKFYDANVSRVITMAARNGAAAVTGLPGGTSLTDADYPTDGTKLYGAVFNAGVQLDANDVPQSDRFAGFKPVQYALIVRSEKPINRDLNPEGNGSIASGVVYSINGIPIFKSNNMAQTNDIAATNQPPSRQHDFSTVQGQVFHRGAAGTVQLQDITMESAYDPRRQGTLMLGKYLVGHGPLRNEASVEIRSANPAG